MVTRLVIRLFKVTCVFLVFFAVGVGAGIIYEANSLTTMFCVYKHGNMFPVH